MKNVGSILKEAREQKNTSLGEIALQTRIKEKFLQALESCDWSSLPNLPIAQGFARNYAQTLGIDPKLVTALLRRDFPASHMPTSIREISLAPTSVWTPRTTIIAVVTVTLTLLGLYLGRQYLQFAAPPPLEISRVAKEDESVLVSGHTSPAATIEINGHKILVGSDGSFEGQISREDLVNSQVQVEAVSRTGKKTEVSRKIDN